METEELTDMHADQKDSTLAANSAAVTVKENLANENKRSIDVFPYQVDSSEELMKIEDPIMEDMDIVNENKEINKDTIIEFLVNNKDEVYFKSQQRGDTELSKCEKSEIASAIYDKSKLNFLTRFGKHLNSSYLEHFKQFVDDSSDTCEVDFMLKKLYRSISDEKSRVDLRNRRYDALQKLISEGIYFSEKEMMRRNPLLYEQLVGQYLSEAEKRARDRYNKDEQVTLVKILLDGIDRDEVEKVKFRQLQEERETGELSSSSQDESDDQEASCSRWGEFEDSRRVPQRRKLKKVLITKPERNLLKDEFRSLMYQSFLDGNDQDFNYSSIDNDDSYDNIEILEHDEEDSYFDSEEPQDMVFENTKPESSEDELDIYMNALNQHETVCRLAQDIKKL